MAQNIKVQMKSTGYTPPTQENKDVEVEMLQTGDGQRHDVQLMPDVACCDEEGYFFHYGFNPEVIVPSGSVTIEIEGGCSNFSWSTDNAEFTFTNAVTSGRTNTLNASAAAAEHDVLISIQDSCGEIVSKKANICYFFEQVATPTILPDTADQFICLYESQVVTMSCTTSGSTIYYTTDGSTPTELSTEYTGGITLNGFTQFKAKAFKSGLRPSEVTIRDYELSTRDNLRIETFNRWAYGGTVIHISGTVYAVYAYANGSGGGSILKTFDISTDGGLTDIDIARWTNAASVMSAGIAHVYGTVYVLVFPVISRTINIADDGTIGSVIDTDTNFIGYQVMKTSPLIFAALGGEPENYDPTLRTIEISNAGVFNVSGIIDSQTFSGQVNGGNCVLFQVDDDTTYGVGTFNNPYSVQCRINTIFIYNNGFISAVQYSTLIPDAGGFFDIVPIRTDIFAMVSHDNTGFERAVLKTLRIQPSGFVGPVYDTHILDTGHNDGGNIVRAYSGNYIIAVAAGGLYSCDPVDTYEIDPDGSIILPKIDNTTLAYGIINDSQFFRVSDELCLKCCYDYLETFCLSNNGDL